MKDSSRKSLTEEALESLAAGDDVCYRIAYNPRYARAVVVEETKNGYTVIIQLLEGYNGEHAAFDKGQIIEAAFSELYLPRAAEVQD